MKTESGRGTGCRGDAPVTVAGHGQPCAGLDGLWASHVGLRGNSRRANVRVTTDIWLGDTVPATKTRTGGGGGSAVSAGVVSTERLPKPQRDKTAQALGKKSTSKSSDLYVREAEQRKARKAHRRKSLCLAQYSGKEMEGRLWRRVNMV